MCMWVEMDVLSPGGSVSYCRPPVPMNHVKIFKGSQGGQRAPRDDPSSSSSQLVQLWYITFPPDHDGCLFGRVEMTNPTRLSNTTSTT